MSAEKDELRQKLEAMADRLAALPHLGRIGGLFSTTVLLAVDEAEFYVTFEKGRITAIREGPSLKTPWSFALRAEGEALRQFWQPVPPPGFHDIFGLVKYGHGRIDGDILLLVKNLRFFKEFLALGRGAENA
jgi:hypothetical protein